MFRSELSDNEMDYVQLRTKRIIPALQKMGIDIQSEEEVRFEKN